MTDPSQFDHMANRAFVSQLNRVRENVQLNSFFESWLQRCFMLLSGTQGISCLAIQ